MWLDRVDDRPKLDLLQEEEEGVGYHLPLWNAREGADSNDYSMASESSEGCRHRRH